MEAQLKKAVERAGGQTAFARMHGISQQRVFNWMKRGQVLPAEFVLKTEALLGIPRWTLRPDIYPMEEGK